MIRSDKEGSMMGENGFKENRDDVTVTGLKETEKNLLQSKRGRNKIRDENF
jgi:hypothetical protein